MTNIFIDGSAGTTGLRIADRLAARTDITLLKLPEALRKDADARRKMLNTADIVFLCLPDDAARESVSMIDNPDTAVIDTSTAHRTAPGWVYGFPELNGQRDRIACAKRIANPGCHASGFIALIAPLTAAGLIANDAALSCISLTGYSGGGKKMIAEYEDPSHSPLLDAPRIYGISQQHKHLPEMVHMTSLRVPPVFCPIVAPFYSGMEVTVPLHRNDLHGTAEDVLALYRSYYRSGAVYVNDCADESGFLSAAALSGRDDMEISVHGNGDRILLVARYDNLGKGASGAAIQNMNILLGCDETAGLITKKGE